MISNFSTHLLIDSHGQKKFLIKKNIIDKKKFYKVINNGSVCGVDTRKFKKNLSIREKIRKNLKLDNNNTLLIYTGRFSLDKGINILIETFSDLINSYSNLNLLLIGHDEMNLKKLRIKK